MPDCHVTPLCIIVAPFSAWLECLYITRSMNGPIGICQATSLSDESCPTASLLYISISMHRLLNCLGTLFSVCRTASPHRDLREARRADGQAHHFLLQHLLCMNPLFSISRFRIDIRPLDSRPREFSRWSQFSGVVWRFHGVTCWAFKCISVAWWSPLVSMVILYIFSARP